MGQQKQRVIISVNPERFDEVRAQLESSGFRIDRQLRDLGVITGELVGVDAGQIRSIPGVHDVETQTDYETPPPDSPIQ